MGGAVANTVASSANTMNSNAGTPVTGRAYTPSYTGGSGGKGGGRPTQTAMGTPITYGKSYINNLSRDYVAPLAKETVTESGGDGATSADGMSVSADALAVDDASISEGVTDGNSSNGAPGTVGSTDATAAADNSGNTNSGDGGGGSGSTGGGAGAGTGNAMANGTTSVPGYAYGSTSVRGYAMGSMGVDDDPWAWMKTQPMSAPLSSKIEPSNEQALGRVPDKLEQQLGSMVMSKGIDAAEKGINTAYKAYNTAAPLATAAETGAAVAEAGTLAGALGSGGTAMMGALTATPIGPLVAGLYTAKKLGIFG